MCVHIMIFCKSFAEEHKTYTNVAPKTTSIPPKTSHPLYLSWLLHSCCYFISIPMHIAAIGQHKAKKNRQQPTYTCRWETMIRSLPPCRWEHLPLDLPLRTTSLIGQDKERLRGFTPPFIIARRRYGTVHCCTAPLRRRSIFYGAVFCRALPLFAVLFSSQAHVHSCHKNVRLVLAR